MSSEEIFDLTYENQHESKTFAQVVQGMLENREELGREFEKIFFDNCWDLYEE